MIDAADVDAGAAVQQEVGDGHRLCFVQRLLAVPAARVDERRIGVDEPAQVVEPAETRRHVRGEGRPAREQEARRLLVGVVEDGVGPVLPVAAQVHVGAGVEQHAQQRRVPGRGVRRPSAEVELRLVDPRPHVLQREELFHAGYVAGADGLPEGRDVARFELGDELRPRGEAGLAGDGELCVGELERTRRLGGVRAHGPDAGEGAGVTLASGPDQILGQLVLLFEVGGCQRRGE